MNSPTMSRSTLAPISTASPSSSSDKLPFPQSHRILQVDQKGNLAPVRISIANHYKLKVEKVDYSVPSTPLTPAFSSPKSPRTPNTPRTPSTPLKKLSSLYEFFPKRFSIGSFSRSSSTTSNYGSMSTSQSSVVSEELIELEEIKEIRLSDYNSKLLKVSAQALKELKPLTTGGYKKHCANEYKVIELLFGNEFNLKCHKFLISGFYDFCKQQQKEQTNVVEMWIEQIRQKMTERKSLGYFDKLDLWYKKQFDVTTAKNTDNHRLKIYKQFLHRCHHRVSTFDLRVELSNLERLVRQHDPDSFTGEIKKPEFDAMTRYFVHSSISVSKIFESLCTGEEGRHVLQMLDAATEEELIDHPVLGIFQNLFMSYFEYMKKYGNDLPQISLEMDETSMHTKAVIRKFAERFKQHPDADQLFQENWLCSYYILDYLFSADNSIWCPEGTKLKQDMTHPMSHYWIYSSHNTYLTGDQYASESSVESYARVLRQGCRCVEIDVWNGPNNKPIVTHGRTLTTSVKLSHVLLTIKAHAFATSPYPIIISIENHCNLRQQKTMAKYFRKIFGKMLLTAPLLDSSADGQITQLPSPEQLKHKIILKGRKLPFAQEELPTRQTSNEGSMKDEIVDPNLYPNNSEGYPNAEGSSSTSTICSNFQVPASCDCLITGELWKSNENGKWIACIFVLTNKKLFYIEKRGDNDDIGQGKLPSYMMHRDLMMRQSISSVESNQDLHNDQLWFHGKMAGGRAAAVLLLDQHAVNGSFLVRESDTTPNGYTLCFYYKDPNHPDEDTGPSVNHCHIHRKTQDNETVYFLKTDPSEHEKFPSIYELIEYYMRNPLITRRCELSSLNTPVPPSKTHEAQEWFYKEMDRLGAERILEKLPINGAFLGRYKTADKGEIIISFRMESVIKHCHINREGRYLTVANLKFSKLENLVEHYSRNTFYKNIKLEHPVGKELHTQSQQSDCVQRVYACQEYYNSTVKTVKGRVRAIQSFSSDDPDLLSFRKGDIIVNVVKEADGWWSGTKKDAVGEEALIPKQFPESFVEDMEELECPFGDYINKGTWKLGTGAKMKLCTDRIAKETGIKFYISFKYMEDGTKKRLGAGCSKRKTKEWVDMINHVVANDIHGQVEFAKIISAEKYNISSEFSDLIIYCCSMDKKICPNEFEWRKDRVNVCSTKSLDELTGDRLFRSSAPFFVWYHQYALTRIYPKGFRLNSSNFSPARFWNFGSQMVALNFQTPDKAMQWNRGKFRQNGNCGYVLKPAFMISGERDAGEFDPTRLSGDGYCGSTDLTIQIISARHLQKQGSSHVTPIVEIEAVGVDADCRKVKTCSQETGLNPHWNQEFNLKLQRPELALIQFSVCDVDTVSDKVLLGESTIPFPCLRTGYRSIQLQNAYGSPLISSLLVHITITKED